MLFALMPALFKATSLCLRFTAQSPEKYSAGFYDFVFTDIFHRGSSYMLEAAHIRQHSVDFLDGRFFTSLFGAFGQSKIKNNQNENDFPT